MLREMQEIRRLALEYSKDDLGRMVQLGLLEPQKAMMAGMMIQRVEQQNAKPPQGTVAQNLLGIQPPGAPAMPQMAQGQPQMPPQMPPQGAPAPQPPMMAADGGLMAIPAGDVGEYAGGGIVAFDDGGEVEGYAKGDLVPAGLFEALVQAESRGKQSAISNKGARGVAQLMPGTMRDPGYGIKPVRDDSEEENRRVGREYLGAMLKKYRGDIDNALAAYNWGPGNVDKHLKKYGELTPEKLPKETRSYIPKVKTFLAQQQRPMEPRPIRVAANDFDESTAYTPAGKLPAADAIGLPALLRRPLEKITRLLPSAEAGDIPAGMLPPAEYARGGITSFQRGGLNMPYDLQTPFDTSGGSNTVYGMTTTEAFGPRMPEEETSSMFGRGVRAVGSTIADVLSAPPGAQERYTSQQQILAKQRALRERLQQLEGYGIKQQTKTQQAEAEQIRKELKKIEAPLREAARTQSSLPNAPKYEKSPMDKAAPSGGFGAYNVPEDQFPLSSYQELLARRQQVVGYTAPDGKIARPEGAPAPGPAPEGGPVVPPFAGVERPTLRNLSFEQYIAKATPKIADFDMTKEKSLKELGDERRQAEMEAGYDQDVFNKLIAGIENKKGKMATEKDAAVGAAIMKAGMKVFGARKGQEFQALSEGAQEGLNDFQVAMKDLRARQEKLDDRIESYRLADLQARKTGVDSDIARRDKIASELRADQRAVFQAKNSAAAAGVQAAAYMSNNDQSVLASTYATETSANTQRYVANVGAAVQSELNNVYRMGMLQANQAKIVMDAANDFIAKNASLPAYMKDPAKLKEDAVAYAYEMGGNLGVLPKGMVKPTPRGFDPARSKDKYGLDIPGVGG